MLLFHNLLIVDSLSAQPTSEAEFWTWKGVLAICAVLVFLGWLIDWLHRKRHKEAILKKLSEFEDKLARLPVRQWCQRIAKTVIRFWKWLGNLGSLIFLKTVDRALDRIHNQRLLVVLLIAYLTAMLSPVALLVVSHMYQIFPLQWYVTLLLASVGSYSITFLVLLSTPLLNILRKLFPTLGLLDLIDFLGEKLSPVFLVSVWFSGIAVASGLLLGSGSGESYWFANVGGDLQPTRPILMSLLNFPFDFITIVVSIKLLRFVKEKGKYIVWIALLDILISAILVVLLHATLKTVEPGGFSHIGQNLIDSWDWFMQVVTFKASQSHPDWPLTPTLFTTFIPVTLYMSAFIFLGIIIKPFARAASYICGLLFEKKQTPFLAFSLILSGLLTVAKALSEWQWFVHQFKQLLG